MDKVLAKIIDDMKPIAIEHHVAVDFGRLQMAMTDCYRSGFSDAKQSIYLELEKHIKDPTLKSLILERISDVEDYYSYLDG